MRTIDKITGLIVIIAFIYGIAYAYHKMIDDIADSKDIITAIYNEFSSKLLTIDEHISENRRDIITLNVLIKQKEISYDK